MTVDKQPKVSSAVEIRGLRHSYGDREAVAGVDLELLDQGGDALGGRSVWVGIPFDADEPSIAIRLGSTDDRGYLTTNPLGRGRYRLFAGESLPGEFAPTRSLHDLGTIAIADGPRVETRVLRESEFLGGR